MVRLAIDGGTPVRPLWLPLHRPSFGPSEDAAVLETLRSGWLAPGPQTRAFEAAVARALGGVPDVIAVSSGTAALHVALLACGVGAGDEVVTTPVAHVAAANAILACGATPVLCDVEPAGGTLDPAAVATALGPRTRAMLAVHRGSHPCDVEALADVARAAGVPVVEDVGGALGARVRGRAAGTLGDLGCFSFHMNALATCGEGGAVHASQAEIRARLRSLCKHGKGRPTWGEAEPADYRHDEAVEPGYQYELPDLLAAVGLSQVARLAELGARRRRLADRYAELLSDLAALRLPAVPPWVTPAWAPYSLQLQVERLRVTRDQVLAALQAENIGAGVHYVGLHRHRGYAARVRLAGPIPHAERIGDGTISLPLFPAMNDADQDDVVAALRKICQAYER